MVLVLTHSPLYYTFFPDGKIHIHPESNNIEILVGPFCENPVLKTVKIKYIFRSKVTLTSLWFQGLLSLFCIVKTPKCCAFSEILIRHFVTIKKSKPDLLRRYCLKKYNWHDFGGLT